MTLPKLTIVLVYSQLLVSQLDADDNIVDQFDYMIVPDDAADLAQGRYPESAPASRELLGHVVGDVVETTVRGESVRLRVQSIQNTAHFGEYVE
ncbi:GreA/GreB family elongation factor [Nocardia spumae]|uniref:GreA/GreB family elongation factor n=1 Tax=Nocardia spumae TaxID=2887190 RepID=UPI001D14F7D7|nr:GreA/GreB family elongation factor [Nocardia spumae]